MNPHSIRVLGTWLALAAGLCAPLAKAQVHAQILDGTGYLELAIDTAAPSPGSAAGPRLVVRHDMLFLGQATTSQDFQPGVAILGQAKWSGLAIQGSAGEVGIALGSSTVAADQGQAFGWGARALAPATIVIGVASEAGVLTTATATGAIAMGFDSDALGYFSLAIGGNVRATGDYSTSLGSYALAIGDRATAGGYASTATGDESLAWGRSVNATTFGGVALGYYNKDNLRKDGSTVVNPATPHPDDPLLTLGNGTATVRGNALTVYRDGTVRLTKASGGIAMGQFQ